jgi:hypothetical protein
MAFAGAEQISIKIIVDAKVTAKSAFLNNSDSPI